LWHHLAITKMPQKLSKQRHRKQATGTAKRRNPSSCSVRQPESPESRECGEQSPPVGTQRPHRNARRVTLADRDKKALVPASRLPWCQPDLGKATASVGLAINSDEAAHGTVRAIHVDDTPAQRECRHASRGHQSVDGQLDRSELGWWRCPARARQQPTNKANRSFPRCLRELSAIDIVDDPPDRRHGTCLEIVGRPLEHLER
jgi:hypothetical protein